jgi:hypothetical protein
MTNCSAPLGPLDAGHFRASLGYGFFQLFQILHMAPRKLAVLANCLPPWPWRLIASHH